METASERAYRLAFEDSGEEWSVLDRRPRWLRVREEHFESFDEKDFTTRFRLPKRKVLSVLELIEDQLEFPTNKNHSISPINQLLCALRFYATGCHQTAVADFSGFSTSTANRVVHKVSCAIASLKDRVIRFPETQAEMRKTQMGFYSKANFPRVLGALDCTHVRYIRSPGGDNAEIFRNRKGYLSLNIQAICNANLEFTDVVARWPGSTHDSHIFNNSLRRTKFEQGTYGDALLVGDSGYGCTRYLMTPLDQCTNQSQMLYNESQIRTRNPIERTFGVWKKRFPVMALGLRVNVHNSFPIIIATMVLHNIARMSGEELPPDDDSLVLPAPWDILLAEGYMDNAQPAVGRPRRPNLNHRERNMLIDNYFANLARRASTA